ncbi:Uncharacterised protein [Klebsiella pneumoniae]|nr:Uncharacterised protein [Klebsiella pneumoniae]
MIKEESKITLLIVLTDNQWLYTGLNELIPDVKCIRMGFDECTLPEYVNSFEKITVAVDSLLIMTGAWSALNLCEKEIQRVNIIWLSSSRTGNLSFLKRNGELLLNQSLGITLFRKFLMRALRFERFRDASCYTASMTLTTQESFLIKLLIHGVRIPTISKVTGVNVKMLYRCRSNILKKTDLRHCVFLEYVYYKNSEQLGL